MIPQQGPARPSASTARGKNEHGNDTSGGGEKVAAEAWAVVAWGAAPVVVTASQPTIRLIPLRATAPKEPPFKHRAAAREPAWAWWRVLP